MKKALPNYDDLFGTALQIIPFQPQAPIRVLDLGAGTGLFASHVLGKYPQASFVLYDIADKMLDVARQRFSQYPAQFEYQVGDYRHLQPGQTFDLVISSLSIHHLSDPEKAGLFSNIYTLLREPGVFINVDQVRGETETLSRLYWGHWLEQVRRSGAPEEQIQASIERRTTYDHDASLADQVAWLKAAGFINVDCVYKNYFVGVFLAMKG
ncbi:MAG: class I SAM-dependent methyltransferase [Anaerolineaceae bacterium]|nr:class I SAM-dependent methyltransferase [Anaerolineaceae bacterium]